MIFLRRFSRFALTIFGTNLCRLTSMSLSLASSAIHLIEWLYYSIVISIGIILYLIIRFATGSTSTKTYIHNRHWLSLLKSRNYMFNISSCIMLVMLHIFYEGNRPLGVRSDQVEGLIELLLKLIFKIGHWNFWQVMFSPLFLHFHIVFIWLRFLTTHFYQYNL